MKLLRRQKPDDIAVSLVSYAIMIVFAGICVFPFIYVATYSLTPYSEYLAHPMRIIPAKIDISAYLKVFEIELIYSGYYVTLFVTIIGTALNVFLLLISAYPLSKRDLKGRNIILALIVFTMFFSGGMIPRFYVVRTLGLLNSPWSLIIPNAISAFNLILMKSFIEAIPESLEESAVMDGANEFVVLVKILLPLSMPAVATFTIFHAVGHWNEYFDAIIYITKRKIWPLMLVLRELVVEQEIDVGRSAELAASEKSANPFTMKMAAIMIATLPIIVVYPFLQRYFMKGILLGSIKG